MMGVGARVKCVKRCNFRKQAPLIHEIEKERGRGSDRERERGRERVGEGERKRERVKEREGDGVNCQIEELKTLSRPQVLLYGVNCFRCRN